MTKKQTADPDTIVIDVGGSTLSFSRSEIQARHRTVMFESEPVPLGRSP
ncbi:TPA: hypothetical protein ACKP8W_003632 [Stenotrophomonas maltophilia]